MKVKLMSVLHKCDLQQHVARNDLLRAVIYPDSDDSSTGVPPVLSSGPDGVYDRVEHRYNRQGEIKETKDQSETVHTFEFDKLGRQTHDRITTLGSGVDGAVRRVSTTYDVRGLVEKITSYDNATVGSGSVVNQVVREYNNVGLLTKEYQEHGGAKTGSTPYVGYNYDESATGGQFTKGVRVTSIRYPDGRLVHHTYGTSGSDDDNLNRLAAIKDDSSGSPGATLADYTYLGLDQVVIQDLPEPDIQLDLFGGTSGTYAGLDCFDRVIDQRWFDYGSSADVDRFKYGYDRASNRTWRENTVSKNLSTPVYLDEFYTYDGLHRLKSMDRGELNGTKTGITGTPAREEDWSLDPLGNWSGYIQKTSGTTDLDQDRSVNKVNEITDISETTGTSWITPSYDKNGNMSVVPRPDDLANGYTCTYDAWNRMVKVEAGISTVAEYSYDGLHRRTTKTVDSTVRHFYYTSSWQAIEERFDTSTSPDRQFIWGPLYIDHLILRDRDTDANSTLDERLYALQDANWNVTALTNTAGDAVERYLYDAYGRPTVMTGAFGNRTDSDYEWEYRFNGRRWDDETGLLAFRTRMLTAELGIFVVRDSMPSNGTSLYEFVRSNPNLHVDPYGLQAARCGVVPRIPPTIIATIRCEEGRLVPYIVNPINPATGRPYDPCVFRCVVAHEQVHIGQFNRICPGWCGTPCSHNLKVPGIPADIPPRNLECPAYLVERNCLLYFLQHGAPFGCDRIEMISRITDIDNIVRNNPRFNYNCNPWPLPPTEEQLRPPIHRLPPVIRPLPPVRLPPVIERLPPVLERLPPVDPSQGSTPVPPRQIGRGMIPEPEEQSRLRFVT